MNDNGADRPTLPVLDQLGARLTTAEAELETPSGRRRVAAIALAAVAVLTGLAFTPPGRVVAGEVGEIVGIGDEPSVPQHAGNEGDAIVIGTGETPGGQPIELVAHTLNPFQRTGDGPGATSIEVLENSDEKELCFNLDLSAPARALSGVCITSQHNYEVLQTEGFGPIFAVGGPEGTDLVVVGAIRSDVSSMTVTYRGSDGEVRDAPVTHGQLTSDLAAQLGVEWTAGGFSAFLPIGVVERPEDGTGVIDYRQVAELMASIVITAYDADGNLVATSDVGDPERWAGLLGMSPPARLADDFAAREDAAKECAQEGIRGPTGAIDLSDPIGSLESTDPEFENCVAEKLAQAN